jgi:Ca-activated chloride channel family protein
LPQAGCARSRGGQNINTGAPVEADATVAAPDTVCASAAFDAGWTGPGNSGDYIDLVPRGHAATSGEITYVYARDAIPVAKLRAPTTPGAYDIRYVLQLAGERKVKATRSLTVTAASASLTPPPKAEGGEDTEDIRDRCDHCRFRSTSPIRWKGRSRVRREYV